MVYQATEQHSNGSTLFYFFRTIMLQLKTATSWWRHNGRDGVSNHQPHDCLINRLFRRRSKNTSKFRFTGLCAGNSPRTGEFPHKWPVSRKMFPLMTSSWNNWYACVFECVDGIFTKTKLMLSQCTLEIRAITVEMIHIQRGVVITRYNRTRQ